MVQLSDHENDADDVLDENSYVQDHENDADDVLDENSYVSFEHENDTEDVPEGVQPINQALPLSKCKKWIMETILKILITETPKTWLKLEELPSEESKMKKLGINSTRPENKLWLPKRISRKINGKRPTKCLKCHPQLTCKLNTSMKTTPKMSQKELNQLTNSIFKWPHTRKVRHIFTDLNCSNIKPTINFKTKPMKFN